MHVDYFSDLGVKFNSQGQILEINVIFLHKMYEACCKKTYSLQNNLTDLIIACILR